MSEWRMIQVAKNASFDSTSGTDTIKIPRTHEIGTIYFYVKAENGATNNAVASGAQQSCEEAIEKIELVSGGKTFRNMSGEMCRRIDAYETGRHPWEERTQEGGVYQHALFRMPFGMEPYDREITLAAPLLGALDLVVDYDFTQSATLGFGTGLYYDVYIDALLPTSNMEQKLTRIVNQKGSYTTASAGEKRFDLTIDPDRMLRRVYVQDYERVIAEGVDVDLIGLYVDNVEVFKSKWTRVQAMNAMDRGLVWKQLMETDAASSGDVIQTKIPNVNAQYTSGVAAGADYVDSITADELTMVATANDLGQLVLHSDVIPTLAVMDFDRAGDLANMIGQGVTALELWINDAASGGAMKYYEESLVRNWL